MDSCFETLSCRRLQPHSVLGSILTKKENEKDFQFFNQKNGLSPLDFGQILQLCKTIFSVS